MSPPEKRPRKDKSPKTTHGKVPQFRYPHIDNDNEESSMYGPRGLIGLLVVVILILVILKIAGAV